MTPGTDSHPSAQACFERGQLLRRQQRHEDAARMFQQALQVDPNHAPSYAMLAFCWMREDGRKMQAVEAARRAVALEPEDAFMRGVLALAIASSAKEGQDSVLQQARLVATEAVQLDADSDFAYTVEAQIYLRLHKYPEAEASARRALAIDTENTTATEVLSAALLMQHKDEDNEHLVRYQLENNPEDDSSHTSAGWRSLMKGEHREANKHFLEALRLNPMNEGARLGLVESYRARSWVYAGFIRVCHAMNRFSPGTRQAIFIGGFIGYQTLYHSLARTAPLLASVLVALWLTLALWSHLVRGFSSFFMLFDKFARLSLRPLEKAEGLVVGGSTLVALLALFTSLILPGLWQSAALALFFSALVSAAAFTNDHHVGKQVYAIAAGAAGVGALLAVLGAFVPGMVLVGTLGFSLAVLIGVAVSWLRNLNVLYA
ncbi:tetratricopeptide repeat protein [Roseimicrobium gellanilyticum]|nr:tetratricopeptide repeat protein [Roseimicrobium gellanilyticum]